MDNQDAILVQATIDTLREEGYNTYEISQIIHYENQVLKAFIEKDFPLGDKLFFRALEILSYQLRAKMESI